MVTHVPHVSHVSHTTRMPAPQRTTSSVPRTSEHDTNTIRGKISRLISSQMFDTLMSAVILLNVVLMIIETDYSGQCVSQGKDPTECEQTWIFFVNLVFLVVYTVESSLRLFADRCNFFKSGWNILDSFIVVSGWGDITLRFTVGNIPGPNTAILRIFRTTRLARIVRIVAVFPELEMLIKGFIGAMMSMFWGFIMILVFVIVFALLSVELLNPINVELTHKEEYCSEAFSSMWNSCVFFLQTLVAGDAWGECAIPIIEANKLSAILFVFALVCVQLGVTNLILAVIVENANLAHERDVHNRLKLKEKEHELAARRLKTVLQAIDVDNSGGLSKEELQVGFENNPELHDILLSMDIERQDLSDFFKLLDISGCGEVDYDYLVDTLLSASMSDVRKPIMMLRLQAVGIAETVSELKESVQLLSSQDSMSKQLSPGPSGPLVKCTGCTDVSQAIDVNSCPAGSQNDVVAKSMFTSTTAFSTEQRAQPSEVIASSGLKRSTLTDLTLLHQSLKHKLDELEQDVLRTIDSWAIDLAKNHLKPDDNNADIPKERVPLLWRGDHNSGFLDHQSNHESQGSIQNRLATSGVVIGNVCPEWQDPNKYSF